MAMYLPSGEIVTFRPHHSDRTRNSDETPNRRRERATGETRDSCRCRKAIATNPTVAITAIAHAKLSFRLVSTSASGAATLRGCTLGDRPEATLLLRFLRSTANSSACW